MARWLWIFVLLTLSLWAQGAISLSVGDPQGLAGFRDGSSEQARLAQPGGLAILPQGGVVVADSGNGALRSIDPAGAVKTLARGLGSPQGISVGPDGQIAWADTALHTVSCLSPQGKTRLLAGEPGRPGRLCRPQGLAWGAPGELWVADTGNRRVCQIRPGGQLTAVSTPGLKVPLAVAYDASGSLWILDSGPPARLWRKTPSSFTLPYPELKLDQPRGLCLGSSGLLFLSDGNKIFLVDDQGQAVAIWSQGLHSPGGLSWEPGGLWLSDKGRHRVQRLNLL